MPILIDEVEVADVWTDVLAVRTYKPYRLAGERNPRFRAEDGLVLDLKDNVDKGVEAAIEGFARALGALNLPKPLRLAVVPGHEARPKNSGRGLARVVAGLVRQSPSRFQDGSEVLLRHKTIDKLATGGDREISIHLKSIEVALKVSGQTLLVLDDVTTSGGSLEACRQLLTKAGASKVGALALGLTTHD